jgi:hypothetical protein
VISVTHTNAGEFIFTHEHLLELEKVDDSLKHFRISTNDKCVEVLFENGNVKIQLDETYCLLPDAFYE